MALAAHHPLAPELAIGGCAIVAALCLFLPDAWLVLLPALLPVIDLAPWTGWLSFEEFDILVLGAAAGAWLRRAWLDRDGQESRSSVTMLGLSSLFMLTLTVALARGIQDAGGFEFGWFQGYEGPMNSLRLAKSFVLAALFAPLLGRTMSRRNPRGVVLLAWGMALGLGVVSLAAIWERLAFPGLLDFSSQYRTTALFWEMHVGGAALDGFLALTAPFAVLLLLRAHGKWQVLPAAVILAMGIYASLTTFSRDVYLAEVASLLVMASILLIKSPIAGREASVQRQSAPMQILLGLCCVAAALGLSHLVFRSGGYRALAAVLGSLTVLLLSGSIARAASAKEWTVAIGVGTFFTAAILMAGWLMDKGAYWAFASVFAVALLGIATARRSERHSGSTLVLAAALSLPVAAAQVAKHWGGTEALGDSTVALLSIALLAAWNVRAREPAWPTELRKQGTVLVGIFSLVAVTVVFGGGTYIGNRFSNSEHDLEYRLAHWRAALDLLRSSDDWLLGKGLGRFPPSFFFGAPGNEFPGSYLLNREGSSVFLTLSGPRYQIGYGEVLRVSQRIRQGPLGRYRVELDYRAPVKAEIHLEICAKHLLYAQGCARKHIQLPPTDSAWVHQAFELDGRGLATGPWYAPRLTVFSVGLETLGSRVDLDNLQVIDPLGQSILANGDFSAEMARWFFTSDHDHLPWHMKNMFLHVLFEQGIVGLAAFGLLVLAALMRSLPPSSDFWSWACSTAFSMCPAWRSSFS